MALWNFGVCFSVHPLWRLLVALLWVVGFLYHSEIRVLERKLSQQIRSNLDLAAFCFYNYFGTLLWVNWEETGTTWYKFWDLAPGRREQSMPISDKLAERDRQTDRMYSDCHCWVGEGVLVKILSVSWWVFDLSLVYVSTKRMVLGSSEHDTQLP